mgnify:CR=1 FL=1
MADNFGVSINEDNTSTSQQGSSFERKSDTQNDAGKTRKTYDGHDDPRKGKGAGKYPNQTIHKTRSGNVPMMTDDSKGNESMTMQHRSGSAMQFLPNGAIQVVAHNGLYNIIFGENRMTITGAQDITVKGEGSMLVYGDYRQTVHGNMEVSCTGSYNITAKDMIMNPRDNFSVAGKTGTMKFSDSMQISAEQTAGIVAGKNALLSGGDMTAVGGGKSAYVAGKSVAAMYSDGTTYVSGKDTVHVKAKETNVEGTDKVNVKSKETKVTGDQLDLFGKQTKLTGDQLDLFGQTTNLTGQGKLSLEGHPVEIGPRVLCIPIAGGNPDTAEKAKEASGAETTEASAEKVQAPSVEKTNMPNRAGQATGINT